MGCAALRLRALRVHERCLPQRGRPGPPLRVSRPRRHDQNHLPVRGPLPWRGLRPRRRRLPDSGSKQPRRQRAAATNSPAPRNARASRSLRNRHSHPARRPRPHHRRDPQHPPCRSQDRWPPGPSGPLTIELHRQLRNPSRARSIPDPKSRPCRRLSRVSTRTSKHRWE
jgi:hypothetical protein